MHHAILVPEFAYVVASVTLSTAAAGGSSSGTLAGYESSGLGVTLRPDSV